MKTTTFGLIRREEINRFQCGLVFGGNVNEVMITHLQKQYVQLCVLLAQYRQCFFGFQSNGGKKKSKEQAAK